MKHAKGLVDRAVFPVGGYGTGILPATKVTPKELLSVVDKPMIQYAVEEALRAGVRQMIFVTHRGKRAIEDHFDKAYELESALVLQNRYELLAELRRLFPPDVSYMFVRQPEPLGLAHAIACARVLVSDRPFLVVVPDELFDGATPAAAQVIDALERTGEPVLGTVSAGAERAHAYVETTHAGDRLAQVERIHGPSVAAPATAAPVAGRFVLTPTVLDYLATTPPRPTGEIELADALSAFLATHPVVARPLEGDRFDCGSRLGYLAATLHFGLRHATVGADFATLVRRAAALPAAAPLPQRRPATALRAAND